MMEPKRYDLVKRGVDIVGSLVGLVLTAPAQVIIAALVARNLGRPVFFRQQRPGRHGQIFTLVKFRTMTDPDPAAGLVSDADRMTPFGAKLRASSLDELPTLWNVLRGDMSLVGPRPLLVEYLGLYTTHQARRHEIRPGITGMSQVSGRNAISWDAKLETDIVYVDRRSAKLDLSILYRTISAVLRKGNVNAEGHATAPKFGGSRSGRG